MLRKVYWDKTNGEVILSVSWDQEPPEKTFDQDYDTYLDLKQRVKDTIALTVYVDGEYEQDFREANAIRMNPLTGDPEFSYPDPSNPEGLPLFRKPLSEEVEELNATIGTLLMESANDKATITSLEDTVGTLLFEVAALKGGAE